MALKQCQIVATVVPSYAAKLSHNSNSNSTVHHPIPLYTIPFHCTPSPEKVLLWRALTIPVPAFTSRSVLQICEKFTLIAVIALGSRLQPRRISAVFLSKQIANVVVVFSAVIFSVLVQFL